MVSFNKHDFVMIKDDIEICDLEKNQVYCVEQVFSNNTVSLAGVSGTYNNDIFVRIAMGRYDQ